MDKTRNFENDTNFFENFNLDKPHFRIVYLTHEELEIEVKIPKISTHGYIGIISLTYFNTECPIAIIIFVTFHLEWSK